MGPPALEALLQFNVPSSVLLLSAIMTMITMQCVFRFGFLGCLINEGEGPLAAAWCFCRASEVSGDNLWEKCGRRCDDETTARAGLEATKCLTTL